LIDKVVHVSRIEWVLVKQHQLVTGKSNVVQ